ncbi:DUF4179 domain-containing protein [Cohnella nanjingensis]|uniref:DUF4179 domain-containing protein n=1 Tax=Cohnella nanjingensis TaxID=1387779 RepID=A0A7X0RWG6_9BACL|nr:DUF4179 domain-containing protein [Cohnella nanjingensis]MBB6674923.1 DUF4179 domain-containing protein [Cohnella nanjingensis]
MNPLPNEAYQAVQERLSKLSPSVPFEQIWDRHRQAKRPRRSRTAIRFAVPALALSLVVVLLAWGSLSPAVGAAFNRIPFIEMLIKKGGYNNGLGEIERLHLSEPVEKVVTDRNIQLTVVEAFYDGVQIAVSYRVDYLKEDAITEQDVGVYYHMGIQGAEPTMMATHENTITGDRTFVGTILISLTGAEMPDRPVLQLDINRIGKTSGNWNVAVPLSAKRSAPNTKTFHPGIEASVGDHRFRVEKVTITPVTTLVVVRSDDNELAYRLEDDLETRLYDAGGGGAISGEKELHFDPPAEINARPRYLTLLVTGNRSGGGENHTENRTAAYNGQIPLELAGNGGGSVVIRDVAFLADRTEVEYDASDAANQRPMLYLVDATGKTYSPIGNPVRTATDRFSFRLTYPKVESEGLQFTMTLDVPDEAPLEPKRVKIPLSW